MAVAEALARVVRGEKGITTDDLLRELGASGPACARASTASEEEEERNDLLRKMEKSVATLEAWLGSSAVESLEPRQYGFVRAQARSMLAQCDAVIAAMNSGGALADAATRRRLDDLSDRLDEIVDTLGWSEEGSDDLVSLIHDETCS